jgi:hypothetical protein
MPLERQYKTLTTKKNKMKKNLIWIGIASALLIGGGAFWYFNNKREEERKKKEAELEAERLKLEEEAKKGTVSNPRTTSSSVNPNTPFTSKAEGDKFRAWVNKNYPSYAKQIDLSLSGDFNNSFIKKAFAEYGQEYLKANAPKTTTTATGIKPNSTIYLNGSYADVYSYPEKNRRLGFISRGNVGARNIGIFVRNANVSGWAVVNVSYRKGSIENSLPAYGNSVYMLIKDITDKQV